MPKDQSPCPCFHVTFLSRSLTLGDHSAWSNLNSLHSSSLPWTFLFAFIWPDLQSHPQPETNFSVRLESLQAQLYYLFAMFFFWTLQLQAAFWGPLQPLHHRKPSLITSAVTDSVPCLPTALFWQRFRLGPAVQREVMWCGKVEKTHQNKTWTSCKPHHLLTITVFKIPEEPLFPYL